MDAAIFLVIEENSFKVLERYQKEITLGGKTYFDEEIYYCYNGKKIFQKSYLTQCAINKIPFDVNSEGLSTLVLEDDVHYNLFYGEDDEDFEIVEIIKKMLKLSKRWSLVYLEEWEFFNEVIECDVDMAISKLYEHLEHDKTNRGFISYSI